MAGLARFFVSDAYEKMLVTIIWLIVFLVCLVAVGTIFALSLRDSLRDETGEAMSEFVRLRSNVFSTFEAMDDWLTAIPCSPQYFEQMRRVAYIPDGLNEFLHVRNGEIVCSVNSGRLETPVALGTPDIESDNPFGISFWLDRDLDFLGLDGLVGTIARRGPHAIIIPPQQAPQTFPAWMDHEVVLQSPDGRWWHRSGEPGLFAIARYSAPPYLPHEGSFHHTQCDPAGLHCVGARIDIAGFLAHSAFNAMVVVVATGIFAAMAAQLIHMRLRRYWAFEARFKRHLRAGILCAYQPIISTRTGEIVGCEVLVRWRDLDGTVKFPDAFLGIVERENLTLELTIAVVETAFAELPARINRPGFRINFNVFPRDFTAPALDRIFAAHAAENPRFIIVAELVETESLPLESVQVAIGHLKKRGIETYIDDFGVGYSNMQNLAVLDIDGVKIDRSFAMAPDNSLMARILVHAVEMARESRRAIVIEGVETKARLDMLRANPLVDYAQGYYISRPLDADAFSVFLDSWTPSLSEVPAS